MPVQTLEEKRQSLIDAFQRIFRFGECDFDSLDLKQRTRIVNFINYFFMSDSREDIPEVMEDYDLSMRKSLPDLQMEFENAWDEFKMHYEDDKRMNSAFFELMSAISPFDYKQDDHELLHILMQGFFNHWHQESIVPSNYEDDPLNSWEEVEDLIIDAVETIIYQ